MSARPIALRAVFTDSCSAPSDLAATDARLRMPAVSTSTNFCPAPSSKSVSMASRVVPLILLTMVRSLPTMALTMLLLPTLGRPTMATLMGSSSRDTSAIISSSRMSAFLGRTSINMSSRSPVPVPLRAEMAIGSMPNSQNDIAWMGPSLGLSHLFTASTTGVLGCFLRIQSRMSWSDAQGPAWPSITAITASASPTAAAACLSIIPGISSALACVPGSSSWSGRSAGSPALSRAEGLMRPPVSMSRNSCAPQKPRT
mmetsp:Transcript_29021/g.55675  ORF Transcript_29021/g.55675 Transcript_29021/m.55675 type:complete len:257 (-) Transcript_29021:766-1536(-)